MPKLLCRGSGFKINYLVNSNLDTTNEFIAQLSDSKGSFDNPIIIGRQKSAVSGMIYAFIPNSIPLGAKYKVRLVYSDTITTPEDWKNIQIIDKPEIKITGAGTACKNTIEDYSSNPDKTLENRWVVSGGVALNKTDSCFLRVLWNSDETGKVELTTKNKNSECYFVTSFDVSILPIIEITSDSVAYYCLNDLSLPPTIAKPDGGTYSGKGINAGIFYPVSAGVGNHQIKYTIIGTNGCSNSKDIEFVVYPQPQKPKISRIVDILESSYDYGNQWFCNDTLLPEANRNRLVLTKSGKYTVREVDSNGCISEMSDPVDFLSDVNENINQSGILSINPNPAEDFIEISVGSQHAVTNSDIRILNVLGETVVKSSEVLYNSQFSIPNSQLRIDVSGLPSGVYFVKVGEKVGKFLKI